MKNQPKILVIDDEVHIRRLLRTALERASWTVFEAASAREALDMLEPSRPDVILLDLGLPDRDGIELVPILRMRSDATLLVVSAREATEQKVTALDLGADDYVTKPFDTDELLARVRTSLRHRLVMQGGQPCLNVRDLDIDLINRRIKKAGLDIHLTPKEFSIFEQLAKFPGRVITHDQLLKSVWPNDYERHIEYLRVVIRNLRQKIEDDASRPAIIVNELGVGYRLIGSDN